MRLYFAGRYVRRLELAAYAKEAEALGHEVTSQWLQGPDQLIDGKPIGLEGEALAEHGTSRDADELRRKCAQVDVDDIYRAEALVSFTGGGGGRGGRHVEFGIGLDSTELYIVGEREHFFHYLVPDDAVVPTWEAFRHWLELVSGVGKVAP